MTYQRVAVLIAGDLRFWNQAAKSIISLSETLSTQIDYFFATWDHTIITNRLDADPLTRRAVGVSEITDQFVGKNLVSYHIAKEIDKENSFYKQSFLNKLANVLKNRHELDGGFIYDLVFEVRPDLLITSPTVELPLIENFSFACDTSGPGYIFPNGGDSFCFLDSVTNDVMSMRYWYDKFNGLPAIMARQQFSASHWRVSKFRHNYLLRCHRISINFVIIRISSPTNIGELTPDECDVLERMFYDNCRSVNGHLSPYHGQLKI